MKITYAAAVSEDEFIAKDDGDVKWLEEFEIKQEETGLAELFADVDGLVMGRATYDFVFEYGSWPYEDKPTWVFTSRELAMLDGANATIGNSVDEVVCDAGERGFKHLWLLGGGQLASSFLDAGLITHLSIHQMPIKLGSGIPLFARHSVPSMDVAEKTITQKQGFKHIEIVLK